VSDLSAQEVATIQVGLPGHVGTTIMGLLNPTVTSDQAVVARMQPFDTSNTPPQPPRGSAKPVITSISPLVPGGPVTITGTGLSGATKVAVKGPGLSELLVLPYVVHTDTTIQTSSSPGSLAPGVNLTISVITDLVSSNAFNATTVATAAGGPPPPAPVITSLVPNTATAAGQEVNVVVDGTGFLNTDTVDVNGSDAGATFVSATAFNVAISPLPGNVAGTSSVQVMRASNNSNSLSFTWTVPGPIVSATAFNPDPVVSGQNLVVTGTNMDACTQVKIEPQGQPVTTVNGPFVAQSATSLTVAIPAGLPSGPCNFEFINADGVSGGTVGDSLA
jgi:hypothetical protein